MKCKRVKQSEWEKKGTNPWITYIIEKRGLIGRYDAIGGSHSILRQQLFPLVAHRMHFWRCVQAYIVHCTCTSHARGKVTEGPETIGYSIVVQ